MTIRGYRVRDAALVRSADPVAPADADASVWIDLEGLDDAARAEAGTRFGVAVPSRAAMAEIESSSRYYARGDALYMTARVLRSANEPPAQLEDLAFILTPERLITVRDTPLRALDLYAEAAMAGRRKCSAPGSLFVGVVEAVIDRLADILEGAADALDALSESVFTRVGEAPIRGDDFNLFLRRIHDIDDIAAKARMNLTSLERVLAFFSSAADPATLKTVKARLRTAQRDLSSLGEQAGYLDGKTQFLMDATLGLIGVDQNNVMKVLSVVSVMLMPPTLLAGIYGMNFARMPELAARYGYFAVLAVMVAFAAASWVWFRRKGWI